MKKYLFFLYGALIVGIMLSCSNDNELDYNELGLPTQIATNTIVYKTSDDKIIDFKNENVFDGAKIISNTYSTTQGYGTIEFASEVCIVGKFAFGEMNLNNRGENIISIVLPNSITKIEDYAFDELNELQSLVLSKKIKEIGGWAISGCRNLEYIDIPETVTIIGQQAFSRCHSIVSIKIPKNVKKIGKWVFGNCSRLTEIHCSATTPPQVQGYFGFTESPPKLYVPKGCASLYQNADFWKEIANIIEE